MADADRVTRRQDRLNTHETNALGYGHFGTATYDDENQSWTFLRQRKARLPLASDEEGRVNPRYSAAFQLVHERLLTFDRPPSGDHSTLHDGANRLLKRTPDAAVAAASEPSSVLTPSAHPRDESRTRPLGSVLAFGNARAPFEPGMHNNEPAVPTLAFPAGHGNERLRLVPLETKQLSINYDGDSQEFCTVPSAASAAAGIWNSSADPIQEVSSPSPREGTQFLVVKPSGTSLLRPLVTRDSLPRHTASNRVGDLADVPGRLLDPCLVVHIPSSRTGGYPHAHAATNPRDHHSIAIVDIRGQWSIWQLRGKRARSARLLYRVRLQSHNDLGHIGHQASDFHTSPRMSEWHRVCWLLGEEDSGDQVLVCNRQCAAVFSDKGEYVGPVDMRLGSGSVRSLILDVKSSTRRRDHIYVLTTSRLMIFTSSEVSWKDKSGAEPLVLVCSWNHYRDRTDTSLSMRLLEFAQGLSSPEAEVRH